MIYQLKEEFIKNYPLVILDEIHQNNSKNLIDGFLNAIGLSHGDIRAELFQLSPKIIYDFIFENASKLANQKYISVFDAVIELTQAIAECGFKINNTLKDYAIRLERDVIEFFNLELEIQEFAQDLITTIYEPNTPTTEILTHIIHSLLDLSVGEKGSEHVIEHMLKYGIVPDELSWARFSPDDIEAAIKNAKFKKKKKE